MPRACGKCVCDFFWRAARTQTSTVGTTRVTGTALKAIYLGRLEKASVSSPVGSADFLYYKKNSLGAPSLGNLLFRPAFPSRLCVKLRRARACRVADTGARSCVLRAPDQDVRLTITSSRLAARSWCRFVSRRG